MALTELDLQNYGPGLNSVCVKVDTDIAVVFYTRISDNDLTGQTLDVSDGLTIDVGAAQQIGDAGSLDLPQDLVNHATNDLVLAYLDGTNSYPHLRRILRTGETLGEGLAEEIEAAASTNLRICCPADNIGLAAYRRTSDGAHRLCKFTVSGGTIGALSPQTHSSHASATPLSMTAIDNSTVLYIFRDDSDGELYAQGIDIATAISEGTADSTELTIDPADNRSVKMLAQLTSTKYVAIFNDDGTTKLITINTSGNQITSFGSPLSWGVGNNPAIWPISSSRVMAIQPQTDIQSMDVSGDTITESGDEISVLDNAALTDLAIPVVSANRAIAIGFDDVGSLGYVSLITGVPGVGNAVFYHGLNSLTEKFTLPWTGVLPQAMTLDKSLGTIVMGSKEPSTDPVIYSVHPYTTGTSTSLGFPTGTSTRALKWI